MTKPKNKIVVQCVGCKTRRSITLNQAAKGQPFCPKCGNMEVAIDAAVKLEEK
jgi:Zn finger protein HypA/HybF involved in hydrogenase expression